MKLDFRVGSVANINFFAEDLETIPFHLSLRRDEKLAVINRRTGHVWHREWHHAFDPGERLVDVHIAFARGAVQVFIDGKPFAKHGPLPKLDPNVRGRLRKGFDKLKEIRHLEIDGEFDPRSLLIETASKDLEEHHAVGLNASLELVIDGEATSDLIVSAQAPAAPGLKVSSLDEVLPTFVRQLPYARDGKRQNGPMRQLVCVLPGRVWDEGDEQLDLSLTDAQGQSLSLDPLSKRDLCEKIESLVAKRRLVSNDLAALQAIEHVKHAAIWLQLSHQSRAAVGEAARSFNLATYLLEGQSKIPGDDPSLQTSILEASSRVVDHVIERFHAAMRVAPERDPVRVLSEAMAAWPLTSAQQEECLLRVSEWFCIHDDVWLLSAMWTELGLRKIEPGLSGDAWDASVRLPFLFMQGSFKAVSQSLEKLSDGATKGWIVTPALGWLALQLANYERGAKHKHPIAVERDETLAAFAQFLQSKSQDYWSHTPNAVLIRGCVALWGADSALTVGTYETVKSAILRSFGLDPAFWECVDAMDALKLRRASVRGVRLRDAFGALRTAMSDPERVSKSEWARLLRPFAQAKCHDYPRFARDLIGPAGVALEEGELPSPQDCREAGMDPSEAVTRFAGYPRTTSADAEMPPDFQRHLSLGVKNAFTTVQNSAFEPAQVSLAEAVQVLMARPDTKVLEEFERLLVSTLDPKAGYLGVSMALVLVNEMLTQGRVEEADELSRMLTDLLEDAQTREVSWGLKWTPGPAMRLRALKRDHPTHDIARRLGAVLKPHVGALPDLAAHNLVADLREQTNPMHDTLVCLYTCRPNLETRVARIRETWLPRLRALGVPVLVFVGNGDGTRDGDVVQLDAPDDYEGLPSKTLAMVEWVSTHTDFSYLYKIDDDCVLDADAFFRTLSHQKFNYCGRSLIRRRGEIDRKWHMAKAQSARGKLELDKSPEPSFYADGGSGYCLSRVAMQALLTARNSAEGQELIQTSFLEDKLVGDLLRLRNIWPDGEDYRIAVLRRNRPGGTILPAWENAFLPFQSGSIKLAHLDTDALMDDVTRGMQQTWPRPFKIWPTYENLRQGWATNTLDLVSPPEKLARINAEEFAVVVCMRNEQFLIRQFLDHYRALGVKAFLCVDNLSSDGTFEYLREQDDVALFVTDTPYGHSTYGVAWQQALLSNLRTGRWSLVADVDEFAFWNQDLTGNLPDLVKGEAFQGANAARLFMLDMYPQGSLSEADFQSDSPFAQAGFVDRDPFLTNNAGNGPYSDAPIWTSALRHRLIPDARHDLFVAQKIALLRYEPWMRLSAGLHFVANAKLAQRELMFAHFKYNAAFREKAAAEVERAQHFNNAEEYRKYLALVSEGRDTVFDPEVSVPWRGSAFVRDVLAGRPVDGACS